jgi:fermentation-respiration switch protein FrsA (DUF1100 family)
LNFGLIKTIISHGGRPDLVQTTYSSSSSFSFQDNFENIKNIPLLFIIGEKVKVVFDLTSKFIKKCHIEKNSRIKIVKGATHFFEEEIALDKVSNLSYEWLSKRLKV